MGGRLPIAFQFMTKGIGYIHICILYSIFAALSLLVKETELRAFPFSSGIVIYDVLLCMCCSGRSCLR
jgi:hypothetical protein